MDRPRPGAGARARGPYRARTTHGVNLNRTFAPGREIAETRAIRGAVSGKIYDLFVDLHGDDEVPGFFVEKVTDPKNVASRALRAFETGALLDATLKQPFAGGPDGYPMHQLGVSADFKTDALHPVATKEINEGYFDRFMAEQGKVPHTYTMETPRRLTPEQQVRGGVKMLRSLMYNVARHGSLPTR